MTVKAATTTYIDKATGNFGVADQLVISNTARFQQVTENWYNTGSMEALNGVELGDVADEVRNALEGITVAGVRVALREILGEDDMAKKNAMLQEVISRLS